MKVRNLLKKKSQGNYFFRNKINNIFINNYNIRYEYGYSLTHYVNASLN